MECSGRVPNVPAGVEPYDERKDGDETWLRMDEIMTTARLKGEKARLTLPDTGGKRASNIRY